MDKMDKNGMDIGKVNIERLKEIFPECVADGKVNFEALREVLGDEIETSGEKYSFNWVGKANAMKIALTPSTGTLIPCKEKSKDWDTTENLYIEGDNLEVLKILEKTYHNKIKMIYIDPPYNTGKDFVYHDDFQDNIQNYLENSSQAYRTNPETAGRFHTDWLNMMYPRLKIARELLTDDGVIFISIDDNEQSNLKKMCDEVFGESNLVAQIPWQSRSSIQNDTDFSVNHEYLCVYAKVRRQENRRLNESNYVDWHKHDSFVCRPLPLDKDKYDNPDNDPRGLWKADPFDAPNVRPNLTYPITNPNTGEQHLPPRGRCWRFLPEKLSSALADNRIVWTNNGLGRPQLKVFYEEKKEFGSVDNSWFSAEKIGTSTAGTKELIKLFDGTAYFDTPKPTSLLHKLLFLANTTEDSTIIDFFSGSATTAHAVMQLNAEDGGKRKFIMVQLPEECDENSEAYKAGYNTICDIGEERIRRAGQKIYNELEEKREKAGLLAESEKDPDSLDLGFKVFRLDSTNIKPWDGTIKYDEQTIFDLNDNVIKDGRSDLDVVYEIMLKYGVFNMPLEEKIINGKTVYSVGENYMIISLNDEITTEDVVEVAKLEPKAVVFKESGFADDNAKINADYTLKRLGVDNVKCI